MALTAVQEAQVKELLMKFPDLLEIANSGYAITNALAYGDVRVVDLDPTTALNTNDVFYVAQNGADVKVTFQQIADYIAAIINPSVEAAVSDAKFYYFGQF